MSRKAEVTNISELLQMYIGGMSEKAVAAQAAVSRGVIRRRLLAAGIVPRNRSQGMYARMQNTSAAERARLADAAHAAVRGKRRTIEELVHRALTRQQTCEHSAPIEFCLGDMLIERGLWVTYQRAVKRYNVDIAIDSCAIAVEVQFNGAFPHCSRPINHARRTECLLNLGWNVCYVLICKSWPLTVAAADYIVAWAQKVRCDHAVRGQYTVIRGNGELVPALSAEHDRIASIGTASE